MTRRDTERLARKRYVLEGARRLFARQGVENTTMEQIAAEVEYTRRTLYAYFRSRDEICLLVLMDDLAERWRRQQQAVAAGGTGLEQLLAWGEAYYRFCRENPHSVRLQAFWDYQGLDRERIGAETFAAFEILNDELAAGLRAIVTRGMVDGSLRPDPAADLTISQYLYTLRAVVARAVSPGYSFTTIDPDQYVRHYLDLFQRAVRAPGGGNR